MDEQWCGSLHIGLTTLAPPELPSCPLSGLSPSLPQLRTKVTWLLCGSEVRRNSVLQRQNYCCSLDRLTVGCTSPPPSCEEKKSPQSDAGSSLWLPVRFTIALKC